MSYNNCPPFWLPTVRTSVHVLCITFNIGNTEHTKLTLNLEKAALLLKH